MKQVKWQKVTEAECWEFESDAKKSIAMNSDSARAPGGGEGDRRASSAMRVVVIMGRKISTAPKYSLVAKTHVGDVL